ncbi:hypothetical protein HID58_067497 [Brassica napus]|uniref:Pentatricopeptide repeat-containing protein n=1 Tax=Brassica napus TaxID=3708 RepID=A0ABQ7ZJ47_BRANA|nr:hypothetical protein HID58_067497 [Brassica napus]
MEFLAKHILLKQQEGLLSLFLWTMCFFALKMLIHGNSVTNGFRSNLQLNNSLVNLYARHGDVKHARKLFDRMPNRDVGSWTAMISGYSRRENHRSALLLFKEMRREPVRANDFTYGSVLMSMSCKDLGCLKEGMQIHGCVEKGRFAGNLVVRSDTP